MMRIRSAHAPLVLLLTLAAASVAPTTALAQRYGARRFPKTPGQSVGFFPTGMNSYGHVVGAWVTPETRRPAVWKADMFEDLPLPNGATGAARCINDSGMIAGWHDPLGGGGHAVIWDTAGMIELGIVQAPAGISNAGHVLFQDRVWLNGNTTFLEQGSSHGISAAAINSSGTICGLWFPNNPLCFYDLGHAARWDTGVLTDLGTLGGCYSTARDINESGQIVGYAYYIPGGLEDFESQHAVLWDGNDIIDLGTLGGFGSRAWAVNERGQILGMSLTARGAIHAFIYETGVMHDIHERMPQNVEPYIRWIYAFNDAGQMLVETADSNDYSYYILTPRPCHGYTTCDMNCDGTINQFDIQPFLMAQANPLAWANSNPRCNYYCVADANNDGSVNQFDIQAFIDCLIP